MTKNIFLAILILASFSVSAQNKSANASQEKPKEKAVVYQVFTRLFGNKVTKNKPWGTIAENGVGKFDDFTDTALQEIKKLGVTHIWYTGVLHHAVINDYTSIGISNDDPDVVKGRAGSAYAVKDYYQVDPDLAVNPAQRMKEFENLIKRSHKNGLKVIIDIVPNHIARKYEGKNNPKRVSDFGANDNTSVEYSRDNNFYYIPGQSFEVPTSADYQPLNGEKHPLSDGKFSERPAKWTGNGSRLAKPKIDDWYETVKINYGVRPDGTNDFPELPEAFGQASIEEHYKFWDKKEVPDSWMKFRDITKFWLDKGVDGFRYDMAEMVPVEFWSYLNSAIKIKNPDAFLLAEVYNPAEYRNYIHLGKMDYLYDKVELYDAMKDIVQGKINTDIITHIQNGLGDIEHNMLHFVDNHDEQRVASTAFAGNGHRGKPLMVVSATISTGPAMLYFGQEVGEQAKQDAGFGKPTRTSIFDYVGVPNHQRWMNGGKFDGGQLIKEERDLRDFYQRLLNFTLTSDALKGHYKEIHSANRKQTANYGDEIYSYVRWSDNEKLIIVTNFAGLKSHYFDLVVPNYVIAEWKLKDGSYIIKDQIYKKRTLKLEVVDGKGKIMINIMPSESFIFKL